MSRTVGFWIIQGSGWSLPKERQYWIVLPLIAYGVSLV